MRKKICCDILASEFTWGFTFLHAVSEFATYLKGATVDAEALGSHLALYFLPYCARLLRLGILG